MSPEKGRVLVIDDNRQNLELAEDTLNDAGYETLLSSCGEDGLKIAMERAPDVVLLDIMMPKISGMEVCRQLRLPEKNFHGKIIMVTAKARTEDKVHGLEAGADDYVTKPYEPEELIARVGAQYHAKKAEDEKNRLLHEIQQDMELGSIIQKSFFTNSEETLQIFADRGYPVEFFSKAPTTILGDFYYPKPIDKNSAGFFFADTCGHGIPAALISMRILSIIDQIRSPARHPSEFLEMINMDIKDLMPRGRFVAGCYLILSKDRYFFANAGQPSPLLLRSGEIEEMQVHGYPLGQMPNMQLQEKTGELRVGDRLILYTDGIIEAANDKDEIYGEKRLLECIRKHADKSSADLKNGIVQDLTGFNGSDYFDDDVTLVIFEKKR